MQDVLKEFKKKFKDDPIMYLSDTGYSAHELGFVSTGSFAIDYAIRQPGIPLGRIVEIFGFPSVGKSTLAASILGSFQQMGGVAILFDTEHSYTPNWAIQFGVIPEKLLLVQPGTLEACMEEMIFIASTIRDQGSEKPIVIVHDSVAATPTQAEIDGDFGDVGIAQHARVLSKAMRKLVDIIWDKKITIVFINQLKERPMAYGVQRSAIGGHAIPFHACIRIEIKKKMILPKSTGMRCEAHIVKNKLAIPYKEATFEIDFEKGIIDDIAILTAAEEMGIITQKGGWYSIEGRDKSYRADELVTEVNQQVFTKIFGEAYAISRINRGATDARRDDETEPRSNGSEAAEEESVAKTPKSARKKGVQVFDVPISDPITGEE